MNQTLEDGKKSNFGPDFEMFAQILGLHFFFSVFTSTSK